MRQHLVPMKPAYTTTRSHVYKPIASGQILIRATVNRKIMPKPVPVIEVSVVYEEPK